MTKKNHIESRRVSQLGEAGLQCIRSVLADHQAKKVNEVLVDAYTASVIVAVYDKINDKNREKLLSLPVARVANICFSIMSNIEDEESEHGEN